MPVFDLDDAPGSDLETRLCVLARWVVDAHAAGSRSACACPARISRPSPATRSAGAASPHSRASKRRPPMSPERDAGFRRLAWATGGLVAALVPHLCASSPGYALSCSPRRPGDCSPSAGWRLPPPLVRGMIAGAVTAGVYLSYSTITGLDAEPHCSR
jgi:hypothetical protein